MEESSSRNPHTWRETMQSEDNGSSMRDCIEKELLGPIGKRYQEIIKENKRFIVDVEFGARAKQAWEATALTQARAECTGHDWYEWRTCEDCRVRPSHKNMSHVLCRFSDPPSPEVLMGEKSIGNYSPGVAPECRCYATPIISWEDDVTWPHRVYADGKIELLTKEQFEEKFNATELDHWA